MWPKRGIRNREVEIFIWIELFYLGGCAGDADGRTDSCWSPSSNKWPVFFFSNLLQEVQAD